MPVCGPVSNSPKSRFGCFVLGLLLEAREDDLGGGGAYFWIFSSPAKFLDFLTAPKYPSFFWVCKENMKSLLSVFLATCNWVYVDILHIFCSKIPKSQLASFLREHLVFSVIFKSNFCNVLGTSRCQVVLFRGYFF